MNTFELSSLIVVGVLFCAVLVLVIIYCKRLRKTQPKTKKLELTDFKPVEESSITKLNPKNDAEVGVAFESPKESSPMKTKFHLNGVDENEIQIAFSDADKEELRKPSPYIPNQTEQSENIESEHGGGAKRNEIDDSTKAAVLRQGNEAITIKLRHS